MAVTQSQHRQGESESPSFVNVLEKLWALWSVEHTGLCSVRNPQETFLGITLHHIDLSSQMLAARIHGVPRRACHSFRC